MKTLLIILIIKVAFLGWTQDFDINMQNDLDVKISVLKYPYESFVELKYQTILNNTIEVCEGDGVILKGIGAIQYQWSNELVDGVIFFPSLTNDYSLFGENSNGIKDSLIIKIIVHPKPIVNFKIEDLSLSSQDPTTGFQNLTKSCSNFNWSFGDESDNSTEFEPIHTFPGNNDGEYIVKLSALSSFGCTALKTKYIHVFKECEVLVPSIFERIHADSILFKPQVFGGSLEGYYFRINNEFGELIYETYDVEAGWDGIVIGDKYVHDIIKWEIRLMLEDSKDSKVFVGHSLVK